MAIRNVQWIIAACDNILISAFMQGIVANYFRQSYTLSKQAVLNGTYQTFGIYGMLLPAANN